MHSTNKLSKSLAVIFLIICIQRSDGTGSDLRERGFSLRDPRIVGGVDTPIESIPYQISIEILRFHMCGGAIVSELWAVTAAHCINPIISGPLWLKQIRAGSTWAIPFIGSEGTIHQIENTAYHPLFNPQLYDYDIGVLKVSNKFLFSSRVKPIIVPTTNEDEAIDYSQNATISGWGSTVVGIFWPSIHLKSALIPLVPREKCKLLAEQNNLKVSPRMICGAGTGKSDTNWGDSGGPIVHKARLIGLVSWGMRLIDRRLPSVYTNLLNPEIRLFIKSHCQV